MEIMFVLFMLLCIVAFCIVRADKKQKEQIRNDIYSSEFLFYKDFENRWIISSGRGRMGTRCGFKYEDGPGCYVILIYDKPVTNNDYRQYTDIYIGQSLKVCQRVHNHLTGKGNGDVYADIRYGKYVYVQFVKCEDSEMNQVEKQLIAAFDATRSYNKTKGGAAFR